MADPWIKVGQAFRVSCDMRVGGVSAVDPSLGSGVVMNYRRPDGTRGTLTPDLIGTYTVSAKVTATQNPLSVSGGDPTWKNGYPGPWEFFPSGLDANGDPFQAKEAIVIVHPRFRNQS